MYTRRRSMINAIRNEGMNSWYSEVNNSLSTANSIIADKSAAKTPTKIKRKVAKGIKMLLIKIFTNFITVTSKFDILL